MTTEKKRGRPAGKSRCEFQAVSYLNPGALKMWLDSLVQSRTILHYWYIQHEPDEDNGKPHQHFRMLPPVSRAVDWQSVADRIVEYVDGEELPRRVVVGKGAVNDRGLDGLLYARHDRRYLSIVSPDKPKRVYDYGRMEFVTDDNDWLDGLWSASDAFEPSPRKMSKDEILAMIDDAHGRIAARVLLRIVISNGYTYGDFQLFERYRCACLQEPIEHNEEHDGHD